MRICIIGDLHYGEKSNSEVYNRQLNEMLRWAVGVCEENQVNCCVQLGDWFHHRNSLNSLTISYGIEGAKILSDYFGKDNVYVLVGNHDIYYKDSLNVTSLSIIEPFVTVIDSLFNCHGVLMTPWIIDQKQWDDLIEDANENAIFVMGHFEFSGFYVSKGHIAEHGNNAKELGMVRRVFSGHYHSPQEVGNVLYCGTPIATTFSEANEAHGIYILETQTGKLEFIEYTGTQTISIPYEQLDEVLKTINPETTSIRVEFPDSIDDESIVESVQAKLSELSFVEVKVKYQGSKLKEILSTVVDDVIADVENIDDLVLKYLASASSVPGVDSDTMIKLYKQVIQNDSI